MNGQVVATPLCSPSWPPLFAAARAGQLDVVQDLLAASDAIVDETTTDGHEHTPLFVACEMGQLSIASALLQANANPNRPKAITGSTPLWIASQNGKCKAAVNTMLPPHHTPRLPDPPCCLETTASYSLPCTLMRALPFDMTSCVSFV